MEEAAPPHTGQKPFGGDELAYWSLMVATRFHVLVGFDIKTTRKSNAFDADRIKTGDLW